MSFDEQILLLPQWVQIWINAIGFVLIGSLIIFLFSKSTRKDALVVFLLAAPGVAMVLFLHTQMGLVRLLGLGHVIFWTPLLVYLVRRLRHDPPPGLFAFVMGVLTLVIAVALVFDYIDVVRWVLGERSSIV